MRRAARRIAVACAAVAVVTAALALLPRGRNAQPGDGARVTVRIDDHGYHVGIVVPVRAEGIDWSRDFPFVAGAESVEFGWGDRAFYTSNGFPVDKALAALFFLSRGSVVHVIALRDGTNPRDIVTASKTITMSRVQYAALAESIDRALRRDATGRVIRVHDGLFGPTSAFFDSPLTYNFLSNCNTWAADALHNAGFPASIWPFHPRLVLRPL